MSDANETRLDEEARELARRFRLQVIRSGRTAGSYGVRQFLYAALLSTYKKGRESGLRQAGNNCRMSAEMLSVLSRGSAEFKVLRELSEHFRKEADHEVTS